MRLAGLNAAAAFMGKSDDPINVGIILLQLSNGKLVRHIIGNRSGAIHTGNHCDKVAGSDSPPRASKSLESAHLLRRIRLQWNHIAAELVIAAKILHQDVVAVHMVALGYG